MYLAHDLITFTLEDFRRGLEGLTPDEGVWRAPKADGSTMNAISWTVQHVAAHWHNSKLAMEGRPLEHRWPPADGTPPDYVEALAFFDATRAGLEDIAVSVDTMERRIRDERPETVAQYVARAAFHTWFHAGEINAVRQLLGHPEVRFVGMLGDRFRWSSG